MPLYPSIVQNGFTFVGPPADGASGEVLITDGAGNLAMGIPSAFPIFEYAESDGISATTSTTPQEKLSLTFTAVAGDYMIQMTAEIQTTDSGTRVECRVQVDDTTDLMDIDDGPDSSQTIGYGSIAMLKKVTLTAASHDIDLDFNSSESGKIVRIKNARIYVTRLS